MSTTTKPRGHQAKPTRAEVKAAWGRLRTAADQGSVQASALLIALVENRPLIAATDTLPA
ncbi:hypothetical protein BFW91_05555 [Pseudomonas fluorescens]|uniref:hypothetical protein n=1 Tax=Pseudomonas fluorescens TaxID=294 RepID=UPI00099BEB65|nr:hypothetical protein [Pseudomonas fluorescens]OPB16096.1 hypothetical protein BFW91_05555 [Pseudomonas fluorescens]